VMDGYEATRKIREWQAEDRGQRTEDRSQRIEDRGQKTDDGVRNAEGGMGNEIGKNSDLKSEIRNHKSEIERLPIIAMTAHAMAGDEQKSIEAGMDGHVTKPIDPDQLFATLQKWIKPVEERAAGQKPPVIDAPPEPDQALPAEDELPESLAGFNLAAGRQ